MGTTKKDLNLMEIFRDLGKVCLTEAKCQKCADRYCLVGYAKDCASQCRVSGNTYVMDGFSEIPPSDIRGGYDEYDVLYAIAHLLTQCRSCKQDHFENCIINIVRSCLEVIEFGEEQTYEGDVLTYLMKLRNINPEKASIIAEEYTAHKERIYQQAQGN
mgnify:CR=1 FL=1